MDLLKLSAKEFEAISALVYERTGIHMPESKLGLLSNRLRKRLRTLGFSSFDDYYKLLKDPKRSEDELPHFLSAVTTNETYFFRNDALWRYIRKTWIPQVVEQKKAKALKTIRVWSAASSSGEEAYTTAICLLEELPNVSTWKVNVIGSDISTRVLDKARAGEYGQYAVAKMSTEMVDQWFDVEGEVRKVKAKLRAIVSFQFHNLRDRFPNANFDLVFLRNVLMYFDLEMKRRVLKTVSDALVPGGHLIVGDVDPLRNTPGLSDNLDVRYVAPNVYQKPGLELAAASAAAREASR